MSNAIHTADRIYVRLTAPAGRMRQYLSRHPAEAAAVRREGDKVSLNMLVPRAESDELKRLGIHVLPLFGAEERDRLLLPLVGVGNRFAGGMLPLGAGSARILDGRVDFGPFYNVDEATSALQNLVDAHGGIARRIDLPWPTVEGRTCHALHISTTGWSPTTPTLVVIGCVHACEWNSCEILLRLAADLLKAAEQGSDLDYGGWAIGAAALSTLLAAMDIVLFPVVNPDGRFHSQSADSFWRKNRNPQRATDDPRTIGVDVNRNFDFLFDLETAFMPGPLGLAVSTDPSRDVYQGPCAESEAETKNVVALVRQFQALSGFVDLHTGSFGVLYPWSDDELQGSMASKNFLNVAYDRRRGLPGDAYGEYMSPALQQRHAGLAQAFADAAQGVDPSVWGVLPSFQFQPSSGTSHDWVHSLGYRSGTSPVPAFAIEWAGDGIYNPLPSQMPLHTRRVSAGLLALAQSLMQA